jgi:hypothetical protein
MCPLQHRHELRRRRLRDLGASLDVFEADADQLGRLVLRWERLRVLEPPAYLAGVNT